MRGNIRRRWWVGAKVLGLAVVLAAVVMQTLFRGRPSATVVAASESSDEAVEMPLRPLTRSKGSSPPALDLPPADMPAHAAVDLLQPLARAGRVDAMRELAVRLIDCAHAPSGTDDDLRTAALKRFYLSRSHEPASDAEVAVVATEVDAYAKRRDDCAGIAPDALAQRMAWLEQAARGGDIQAQIDFARPGLNDMGRDEILMQPDEVERRRGEAGDYLQRALAGGDCEALDLLAEAYSGQRSKVDWIFQPNPGLSAAYAAAARLRGDPPFPRQDQAQASLNADQLAAAERQGQALYARYCQSQAGD